MWVAVRVRDGKRFSVPADRYRAEGIAIYIANITGERMAVTQVDEDGSFVRLDLLGRSA